ncbi:MAG: MFS transporter, partial [Alphaproteobacteria bacterium]
MFKNMIKDKRFLPLLVPHFLSEVCDGFIRTVFLFFVTYKMTEHNPVLIISAGLLFALSFCFASVFAGQIADKFSKTKFVQAIRILEIGIMLAALVSLSLDSRWWLVFIVAAMGIVNACARVADYSLLPVLVDNSKLNNGNIWLKLSTAAGGICATLLLTSIVKFDTAYYIVCTAAFILSVIGFLISLKLPLSEAMEPDLVIQKSPHTVFGFVADKLKNNFDMWAYLFGVAWYWLLAAVVIIFSAEYGRFVLNARWSVVVFLSGIFAVGYIAGSLLYARVSRKNNMGAWTALVSFFISLFLFDLVAASNAVPAVTQKAITIYKMFTTDVNYWRIVLDIFVLGVLSAFYIIPFYALLQTHAPHKILGRVMAFSNMMNAIAVLGGFLIVLCLRVIGFDLLSIVVLLAVINLLMALYMIRLMPLNSRRALFKKLFTTLFDAKIEGLDNLAVAGPRALIVTNHSSYLDVLLISAFIDKKILFTVSDRLIDRPLVKFMTNLVEIKPLDPVSPFAVKDMAEELQKDKLCMILTEGFIEGGNTRMKLYEGPAMMAMKGNAPILPIRIDGAKHALFSRVLGKKADFQWFPKITLTVLPPVDFAMNSTLTTREIREKTSSKLYDIFSDMTFRSYNTKIPVFTAIARSMKMAGRFKPILEDTARRPMKFMMVFLKSFVLGRLLNKSLPAEKFVGLMMPTSGACALAFFGLHAY